MPYKDPEIKRQYDKNFQKSYYKTHKKQKRDYNKLHMEQRRISWRNWKARKTDKERIEKINLGLIYKPKKNIYGF